MRVKSATNFSENLLISKTKKGERRAIFLLSLVITRIDGWKYGSHLAHPSEDEGSIKGTGWKE